MRGFMKKIEVLEIENEVDPYLEIARILRDEERTVLFKNVKNSKYNLIGNLCNTREKFAISLGIRREDIIFKINEAIENPTKPKIIKNAPCQEIIEGDVNLSELPIPTFTSRDMGPYITSGVFIASDKEYGQNMSFHRASPISNDKLVARICKRDLYEFMKRADKELDVAICIGLHPSILISAAISVDIGVNELEIANSLNRFNVVKCKTNDILIPADTEIVLEGKITMNRHKEGPFPDITRTYDIIRNEPVIKINCITHRKDAIYHTILPASIEHQLLMGMPREPLIYNRISRVCKCKNVLLTSGGCSWLHGVIQIEKRDEDDGKNAIRAAFDAHKSMKHVVVVDSDIDIYNIKDIEWSIATRFQADRDMIIKRERGSSLDPSADDDCITTKVGLDATIPWSKKTDAFKEIKIGE